MPNILDQRSGGTHGESDPPLGNREPSAHGERTDDFSPTSPNGVCRRMNGLPQFVTLEVSP